MNDVSRGTPPRPGEAEGAFPSERLPLADRYADWLVTAGVERGLIGPREAPRVWDRHLLNCAVVAEALPHDVTVADVGSGAGLPGLVLGIARPDLRLTLIEPLLRRATFLDEVVADLDLSNVSVLRSRAEDVDGSLRFDVVTSRAVAPLDKLVRWCLPLAHGGGHVLAMKGSSAQEEVERTSKAVRKAGGTPAEVLHVGQGVVDPPVTLVRVAWRLRGERR